MSRVSVLCLLVAALAASCAAPAPHPADLATLIGTWKLTGDVPAGARIPTLSVQRDGSVGGTSGVNRYQARLDTSAIAQGNFRMGPTAGTRMMGTNEAMQLETSFLEALQEADRAVIEGNLLLLKRGERTLLRLERVTAG